jgi:hypothetical protein
MLHVRLLPAYFPMKNKNELTEIPGVGKSIAADFARIGIKKISDLKGKDPEELYKKICAKQGCQVDRCVLYVCRSSVYFAENKNPDSEKLKWWNWKDSKES